MIYHYAWRGGPRFWSSQDGTTEAGPEYWASYHSTVQQHSPSTGKFRQVIQAYLKSREFAQLKDRTRKDIHRSLFNEAGIDDKFGKAPIGAFNRPEIRRVAYDWRDGFASDRVADMRLSHLSAIVSWAVDRGWLTQHHLKGMRKVYSVDRSEIVWTQPEIDLFCEAASPWLARVLIAATETGLRPADLAKLAPRHIHGEGAARRILIRTSKRDRMAQIPVTEKMAALIDATPRDWPVFLPGQRGRQLKETSLLGRKVGETIRAINAAAEAEGLAPPINPALRLYDARGTAATRLFLAGLPLAEIAKHMGWSPTFANRMIEIYASLHGDLPSGL